MDARPRLLSWLGAGGSLLGMLFVLPPLIQTAVVGKAKKSGWDATIEAVRLRPTRIWLDGVSLRHSTISGLSVELPSVEVRLGFKGITEVVAHGGAISLRADGQDPFESLRSLRGEQQPTSDKPHEALPISALDLHLDAAWGSGQHLSANGMRLSRANAQFQTAIDELSYQGSRISANLKHVEADWLAAGLLLEKVAVDSTELKVRLDGDQEVRSTPTPNPPSAAPPANPQGEPETPNGPFALAPGRGEHLRSWLASLLGSLARRIPENGAIDLSGVSLELTYHRHGLNFGPAQIQLSRGAKSVSLTANLVGRSEAPPLRLAAEFPLANAPAKLSLSGGPLSLAELGVHEDDFGLHNVRQTQVTIEGGVEWSASGDSAAWSSHGQVAGLGWSHPRVADAALEDLSLTWAGKGSLNLDASKFEIEPSDLGFGAVHLAGSLSLQQAVGHFAVRAQAAVSRASCQDMFDSLPVAIVPLLQGTKFSGNFSWSAALDLDTDQLADGDVQWRMQNGCKIEEVPSSVDPARFEEPFTWTVSDAEGIPRSARSGPGSSEWVPFERISHFMEQAVLTTEDGGFYRHHGFDQGAIEGSIRSNLEAGKFVRGASTISMQLAKNLYLSREKRLSRKVQEALLTMLLEQELSKEQILELYFNVIEFAPDVYGIGAASQHYFNSRPDELSLSQAFFLASILPNPHVQHFDANGTLQPQWAETLQRLMRTAAQRKRISDAELEQGLKERVQFGVPNLAEEPTADDEAWTHAVDDPWAN
jgi:hypothetical protein